MPVTIDGTTGVSAVQSGAVDLTTDVTGVLPNANGGLPSAGTSGNILTSNGTAWVSQALPSGGVTSLNGQTGAITNTDYGSIGSYVIAGEPTFSTNYELLPNVTVAGSNLIRSSLSPSAGNFPDALNASNSTTSIASGSYTSLGLSGTWRRLTRSKTATTAYSAVNLYVRIS